jgi:putative lipase involved disintegration of autophagic bodies
MPLYVYEYTGESKITLPKIGMVCKGDEVVVEDPLNHPSFEEKEIFKHDIEEETNSFRHLGIKPRVVRAEDKNSKEHKKWKQGERDKKDAIVKKLEKRAKSSKKSKK